MLVTERFPLGENYAGLRCNYLQSLVVFVLLFFFIFSPRLDLGLVLHLGYISVVVLAISIVIFVRRFALSFFRSLFFVFLFFFGLAVYHLMLASIYENNPIYFVSICASAIVNISFGWLLSYYLLARGRSVHGLMDYFIMLCAFVIFLNSFVILVEYLFPSIKHYLESILLNSQTANINYATHPFRLRGLSAAGGAALSVINAFGIILFLFLVKNKNVNGSIALLCSLVIVFANIFTGRTGLMFSLLFIAVLASILAVRSARYFFSGSIKIMPFYTICILFVGVIYAAQFEFSSPVFRWAFEWFDGLRHGKLDTSSSDHLMSMMFLPDNPLHLLFGIGFFEGVGQLYPRTDSGYLKTILSVGLLMSVVLYSFILFLFLQLGKVSKKYLWLVIPILGFVLIVEVKEPFLYQNYTSRVIFLLSGVALFILDRRHKC